MVNKNEGEEPQEGKDHIHEPLKNRFGANFKARTSNVVNPNATGMGKDTGPDDNPSKAT